MTLLTYPFADVRFHARPVITGNNCMLGFVYPAVRPMTAAVQVLEHLIGLFGRGDHYSQVLLLVMAPSADVLKDSI